MLVTRMFTLALVWAQPIHDTWSCHLTLLPCRQTAAPGGFVETTIAVCGKQACMQQQLYCPHDVAKREQRGQGSSLYWWRLRCQTPLPRRRSSCGQQPRCHCLTAAPTTFIKQLANTNSDCCQGCRERCCSTITLTSYTRSSR